jgi:hypothetical protein
MAAEFKAVRPEFTPSAAICPSKRKRPWTGDNLAVLMPENRWKRFACEKNHKFELEGFRGHG